MGHLLSKMTMTIQTLINEAVRRDEKKAINSWHPSKLGSCLCGAYLERMGVTPDTEFDDRTLRVFSAGKHFEEWLCDLIKDGHADIQEQVRIEWPKMNVTGYADLIIGDTVYEIKSKHSRAFWWMVKKNEGPGKHHMMQLWTYLKVLEKERGELVYVSKDDLAIQQYPVYLNDKKLEKAVLAELTTLNQAWERKLPPRPAKEDTWQAKYCRFHKQCVTQPNYLTNELS